MLCSAKFACVLRLAALITSCPAQQVSPSSTDTLGAAADASGLKKFAAATGRIGDQLAILREMRGFVGAESVFSCFTPASLTSLQKGSFSD
jgi:hypothetical protein